MYWADEIADKIKERNLPLEWVDDMKTPSGRVHVGSLLGVVVHGLVYQALKDKGVNARYSYVFENHDPMDALPSYLPKEKYEQYLGSPLFSIPSPVEGYANFAEYYAQEFKNTFNQLGFQPEIIWTKDLYNSGRMNESIRMVLDKADIVRGIYKDMYQKDLPSDWYAFQVYCEQCGKVSTTRVYNWDGEYVYYRCPVDAVNWTKGCGYEGKRSPFSNENEMAGKLPWKIEWPVKWKVIGVTVEGAGKDHMSKGGSHDFAKLVCERLIDYPVPYPIPYEFLLIGGRKMSSSKGVGFAAADMLEILPANLVRFLMVKKNLNEAMNFDPSEPEVIPRLFDEYQEYAQHYFENQKDDYARIFELSQIGEVEKPPMGIRFSTLVQWVQTPNMEQKIKEEGLEPWVPYAKVYLDRFAPESEKFMVQEEMPEKVKNLSSEQKAYLGKVAEIMQEAMNVDELQVRIYELAKEMGLNGKAAFQAIYVSLLGKDHGPKAAPLIVSLGHEFVRMRFGEAAKE